MFAESPLSIYLALERAMVDFDDSNNPEADQLRERMDSLWLELSTEDDAALDARVGDPAGFAGSVDPQRAPS
jgi:hypothetical protein